MCSTGRMSNPLFFFQLKEPGLISIFESHSCLDRCLSARVNIVIRAKPDFKSTHKSGPQKCFKKNREKKETKKFFSFIFVFKIQRIIQIVD